MQGAERVTVDMPNALRRLKARGPDACGVLEEPGVILGHRRLAIIDDSMAANQPLASACGRYAIVFNGEVYNYTEIRRSLSPTGGWRTESDTETVVEAFARWGADCLSRFHGMFALAIWDRASRSLFLARDRVGVKPLYYRIDSQIFAFASRPNALRALLPGVAWEADRQAVRWYLEAGYVPAPYSFYSRTRKLEPGHYVIVDAKGCRSVRYWSLDHLAPDAGTHSNEDDLLDELDALLDRSVRWRMVSSVPVGAFLSGGVDSALVVTRMAKVTSAPVKTFTIGFADQHFDESGPAAALAELAGVDHEVQILTAQDMLELLPRFFAEFDEPFYDYSAIPVMAVARFASQQVKVVLSGDGGDEAFGGYHYYRAMAWLEYAYRLPNGLRRHLGALMRRARGRVRLTGYALEAASPIAAFAFARSVIKDNVGVIRPSLRTETEPLLKLYEQRARALHPSLSAVETAMRLDIALTLPDDYLQKVDVGTMAFSLEAREPLLDHTILEWCARLPTTWKLRPNQNKYLLRKLAYRHVPRQLLDRPKRGFGVPMAKWLRSDLATWARDALEDEESFEAIEVDREALLTLWNAHSSNRVDAASTLWSVLVLAKFVRQNILDDWHSGWPRA